MNQKELREIRKRFTLDKDSISHVYGCYVNAAKDIVAPHGHVHGADGAGGSGTVSETS